MDDANVYGLTDLLVRTIQRNNGYLARAELDRLMANYTREEGRLEPCGFKVYSQGDEDGVIEEIFRRLKIEKGRFCEIGVENGLECNTLYLLHKGWRGCWIEGNQQQQAFILDKFSSIIPARLVPIFSIVTAENINRFISQLVRQLGDLDFLSIDIDGNDIYLLEALEFAPKVLCVEYNAKFPGHISKRQIYDPTRFWTGTDYMGSSLKALAEVAQAKGYRLVGTNVTGVNAFFVRNDLAGALFPADPSPENLYNPPRYWLIFDHFQHIGHRPDFGEYADMRS